MDWPLPQLGSLGGVAGTKSTQADSRPFPHVNSPLQFTINKTGFALDQWACLGKGALVSLYAGPKQVPSNIHKKTSYIKTKIHIPGIFLFVARTATLALFQVGFQAGASQEFPSFYVEWVLSRHEVRIHNLTLIRHDPTRTYVWHAQRVWFDLPFATWSSNHVYPLD